MNEQRNNGGEANVAKSLWERLPFMVRIKILLAGGMLFVLFVIIFSLSTATSRKSIGSVAPNFLKNVDEETLTKEEKNLKKKIDTAIALTGIKDDWKTQCLLVATIMYAKKTDVLMAKNAESGDFEAPDNEDDSENMDDDDELNSDDNASSDGRNSSNGSNGNDDKNIDIKKVTVRELVTLIKKIKKGKEYYRSYLIQTYLYKHFKNKTPEELAKIADNIFRLADYYKYLFFKRERELPQNCDPFGDVMVEVLGMNGEVLDTISFQDYVLGVFYGEVTGRDIAEPEYGKAFYIAMGTFALVRGTPSKNTDNAISITSSTNDQVWCDIYKGCYRAKPDRSWLYPGEGTEVGPMSESDLNTVKSLYNEIAGLVRVDDDGNLVNTQYRSDYGNKAENIASQNEAYQLAKQNYTYEQILDYYYEGKNEYQKGNCPSSSGSWSSWKQGDSSWSSVPLGNSNVGSIGCLVTSIAMQISRSGVDVNVDGEFNPGTFANALTQNGLIGSGGGLMSFDFGNIAPDFKYVGSKSLCGMSEKKKAETVENLIDQGYYAVMEVKGNHNTCGESDKQQGQHWVAVTEVNGKDIKMSDPAGVNDTSTDVWGKYGNNASQVVYFKVK